MDTQYQKIKSLTLKQFIYALAAADEGNVTAAARRLHVSQPAVSSAIAAIERHYGTRLFSRLPAQGMALTPFGVEVMAQARQLCDQAQTLATLATPEAKIAGQVAICCYQAIAPFVLPRMLRHLARELPSVTIRIQEADLEGAEASLRQGRADLAITYDLGMEGDIHKQVLYDLQPQVICSQQHEFAQCKSIGLASLHRQKLILLDMS